MTFIHRFFENKNKRVAVSLEYLRTDMHSHLIPGIDDGAQDMETAVQLADKMKQLGFSKLITTPHIMADLYRNTPGIILEGLGALKAAVADAGISIEIQAAAEYMVDEGMLGRLQKEELMTMGDRYVLIELPYFSVPELLNTIVFEMQIAGYKPILAHPERYEYWHNQFSKLEALKERGVFFQINTISLSGYYSHATRKTAERLIESGMVDFLGSDLHNHQSWALLEKSLTEPELEKVMISGKLRNHLL